MLSILVPLLFLQSLYLFYIRLEFIDRLLTNLLLSVIKVVQHSGPFGVPLLPRVLHHLKLLLLELLPRGLPLVLRGKLLVDALQVQLGLVHGIHLDLLESLNPVHLFGDAGLHIHELLSNSRCIFWGREGRLEDTVGTCCSR